MDEPVSWPEPELGKAQPSGPFRWSKLLELKYLLLLVCIAFLLLFALKPKPKPAKIMGPPTPAIAAVPPPAPAPPQARIYNPSDFGPGSYNNPPSSIAERTGASVRPGDFSSGRSEETDGRPAGSETAGAKQPEQQTAFEDNMVVFKNTSNEKKEPADTAQKPGPEPENKDLAKDPFAPDPTWPKFWIPKTTLIPGVLDSEINGEQPGPVDMHTTTDVYYPQTRILLIPQGTRWSGEAAKVNSQGQTRMGVVLHSLTVYPPLGSDGRIYTIPLDKQVALDQRGAAGVPGKVSSHILRAVLAAGAVGLIQGAEYGTYSLGRSGGVSVITGVTQSTSQTGTQILDRYLTLPTIRVPAGHRVNIRLTENLEVPEVRSYDP